MRHNGSSPTAQGIAEQPCQSLDSGMNHRSCHCMCSTVLPTEAPPPGWLCRMQTALSQRNSKGGQTRWCLKVEGQQRQTIWHYQAARSRPFLRVVVATPQLVTQARSRSPPAPARPTYSSALINPVIACLASQLPCCRSACQRQA